MVSHSWDPSVKLCVKQIKTEECQILRVYEWVELISAQQASSMKPPVWYLLVNTVGIISCISFVFMAMLFFSVLY